MWIANDENRISQKFSYTDYKILRKQCQKYIRYFFQFIPIFSKFTTKNFNIAKKDIFHLANLKKIL